ncbi:hypothetical protein ACS0TY_036976 [Phlomoides rotata]
MSWIKSVIFWTNFAAGTQVNALLSRVPQALTPLNRKKSDYIMKRIPRQGLELLFKKEWWNCNLHC